MTARRIGYMPEDKDYEAIGRYVEALEAFGSAKIEISNLLGDIGRIISAATAFGPKHDPTRAYIPDVGRLRELVGRLDAAVERLVAITAEANAYADDAGREKVEVVVTK